LYESRPITNACGGLQALMVNVDDAWVTKAASFWGLLIGNHIDDIEDSTGFFI